MRALLGVCLVASTALAGGRVTGTVTVEGLALLPDGGLPPMAEVVVYVTGYEEAAPATVPSVEQRDTAFVPDVLPVVKGQSVAFPNFDRLSHNVFSTSRARRFDLGQYAAPGSKTVAFPETGLVEVYCNIHETMAAAVLVLPNRAFQKVRPGEAFSLDGVPPGRHRLFAWTRRAPPVSVELVVEEGQTVTQRLALVVKDNALIHLDKYGRPYRRRAAAYGP